MRRRLIRHLKEIGTAFSTNELAFYCLTNSFELPLRDKLAYRLQLQYPKFVIRREWNKVDISIHDKENTPKALIEIKYSHASLVIRRKDINESRILKSLKKQYKKSERLCEDWHGLIFLSCPASRVPEKYLSQVKYIGAINKYVAEYSKRGWRLAINKAIQSHFSDEEFIIKNGLVNAGNCFDTNVNLLWFLITKKS